MKALTCEMCGSTNLIKEDGVFVCQSCSTKYSVEEARKMMIEGTVSVKIDTSDELTKLYEIARRAKDADNHENAAKYYDQILVKDPNSWEAAFYVTYCQAMQCKIAGIYSAASQLLNCEEQILSLIKNNIDDHNERLEAITEVYSRLSSATALLYQASTNHFNSIDYQIRDSFGQEHVSNSHALVFVMYTLGNLLIDLFGDEFGPIAALGWIDGIEIHSNFVQLLDSKEKDLAMIDEYHKKILQYDSDYLKPETTYSYSEGCYVATAVYGSYDCPEVWTLRRFRDFTLAESWYGRAFIKAYYAISPTLVRWFGDSAWFKNLFQKPLDNLVQKLHERGVENTPYNDRIW